MSTSLPSSSSPNSLPSEPAQAQVRLALELALDAEVRQSTFVGPYRLVEQIGEGGFGIVWLAEQVSPVQRRVALKLLKAGMDTKEVIARFAIERQALALMDHPNIARVFEAGETDAGRPYFVMEFVRGLPITSFCDSVKMPLEHRLGLFISVCHAVQHAHQKGVIHRDLKPANILVSTNDGIAAPKIIDFGIAKAIAAPFTAQTVYTRVNSFLGTPVYTSPEQMEMSGVDVDTRSDIYSLGILLYELITGVTPFDTRILSEHGLEAMRRAVRETDPPRPSSRLSALSADELAEVAEHRIIEAKRLVSQIKGDLDAIVLRCLEKDRARRYETTGVLAADVAAFLDGKPITARNPGGFYRAKKFVRRHRTIAAASAVTLTALIGGLAASSILLVREKRARERAVLAEQAEMGMRAAADRSARAAVLAAVRSEQVARFMKDMLRGVGPEVALGQDTTLLRRVLDRTTQRLTEELDDVPDVATDLRDTLGVVYRELGDYEKAETLLRQAVASLRLTTPLDPSALGDSLHSLGQVLAAVGKHDEADQILHEALALRRQAFGPEHPEVIATLSQLSAVPLKNRSLRERERMLKEVLEIQQRTLGPQHADVATTLIRLAWVAMPKQEPEKALALQKEGLAMRRTLFGEADTAVADALSGLGQMHQVLGDFDAARRSRRDELLIHRQLLRPTHPTLVVSLLMFSSTIQADDPERDVELVQSVVSDIAYACGHGSAHAAAGRLALASLRSRNAATSAGADGEASAAVALLDSLREKGKGLNLEVIEALDWCAFGMYLSGHSKAGLSMAEVAARAVTSGSTSALSVAQDMNRTLGCIYYSLDRLPEAATAFEKTVSSLWSATNVIGPRTYLDHAWLGATYRRQGRLEAARNTLLRALHRAHTSSAEESTLPPLVGTVQFELGLVANAEGNYSDAEHRFREALASYGKMDTTLRPWQRHYTSARARSGLGKALAGQGQIAEAEKLVLQAYRSTTEEAHSLVGTRDQIIAEALDAVVWTYLRAGDDRQAAAWSAKENKL